MKTIFGFGSLLDMTSLKHTVPTAKDIQPCYIKGFTRNFNIWDPIGFSPGFPNIPLELISIPMCAVDVNTGQQTDIVNGICFSMTDDYFEDLLKREKEYNLIETNIYCFKSHKKISEGYVFSAEKNNGSYNFGCYAQDEYLKLCLKGAKEFGENFYQSFLETTFINNKPLTALQELKNITKI